MGPNSVGTPPRVLALSDHLGHPGGRVHGATTYYVNVYPALRRAGIDLTVAFLSRPHPAADLLHEQGVEPIFLSAAKWNFGVYRELLKLVDQKRAQILHLSAFKSHFLGRLAAGGRDCRTIVHLHDTVPLRPHVKLMQRAVRRRTDLALGVSDPVGELGVRDYGLPRSIVRTLHNAIDMDRFRQPRPNARAKLLCDIGLVEPVKLIGVIGRLAAMKGHRHAIEAMPFVLQRCPDAKLVVVGEGELRGACERQVRQLGIGHAVVFTGQRSDVPDVLAAVDVVAMPSISGEGLPYAAIEAIASGKVIVAFPTAGIPEVVLHDQVGLLVEHGQARPFADALVRVLTDDALRHRLATGAREHAQHFTIRRHVEELAQIYRSLLEP